MPRVLTDPLYNKLIDLFELAVKHAQSKEEKQESQNTLDLLKSMPRWRSGQNYQNPKL